MFERKSIWSVLVITVTLAWVLGSTTHLGADTLKYKAYTFTIREEDTPIGDEEGHLFMSFDRGGIYVFENGEVANYHMFGNGEEVKGGLSVVYYGVISFQDGATMMLRVHGTLGTGVPGVPTTGGFKSEIVRGTGRFEGIKGTASSSAKYLPLQKWQAGVSGYGEGTIEYTLPPK